MPIMVIMITPLLPPPPPPPPPPPHHPPPPPPPAPTPPTPTPTAAAATTCSSLSELGGDECALIASPSQSPGVDERHLNFKFIPLFGHDRFLPDPVKFSSYRVMDAAYAETPTGLNDIAQNFNSCHAVYPSCLVSSWLFSICVVTDSLLRVMWHAGRMEYFFLFPVH